MYFLFDWVLFVLRVDEDTAEWVAYMGKVNVLLRFGTYFIYIYIVYANANAHQSQSTELQKQRTRKTQCYDL